MTVGEFKDLLIEMTESDEDISSYDVQVFCSDSEKNYYYFQLYNEDVYTVHGINSLLIDIRKRKMKWQLMIWNVC